MTEPAQMSAGDLLGYMGISAPRWAEEFVKRHPDIDEGEMLSWFASSIENRRSAGMKVTCPHSDVFELSSDLSSCRVCGTLFDADGVAT